MENKGHQGKGPRREIDVEAYAHLVHVVSAVLYTAFNDLTFCLDSAMAPAARERIEDMRLTLALAGATLEEVNHASGYCVLDFPEIQALDVMHKACGAPFCPPWGASGANGHNGKEGPRKV